MKWCNLYFASKRGIEDCTARLQGESECRLDEILGATKTPDPKKMTERANLVDLRFHS